MAIKRVTFELDYSPDLVGQTKVPDAARLAESKNFKTREVTGLPIEKEVVETKSLEVAAPSPRAPGRTMSDLVAEFVNQPRAMATVLMFLPFAICLATTHIPSFGYLIYPLTIGILLNIVWFGIAWITNR